MKQRLKKIYQDLFNAKLTQKEALEKIKALKLNEQKESMGILHTIPVWEQSKGAAAPFHNKTNYIAQHIVLCELPNVDAQQVESLVANTNCSTIPTKQGKNVADRYNAYAYACFEKLQTIIQQKPQGKVLVQIFIPNSGEEKIFAGISGILKTAALENPQIVGQIILTEPQIKTKELAEQQQKAQYSPQDTIIKYEQGKQYTQHWQEIEEAWDVALPPILFKDNGVYLITGGLGRLGILFAKEITQQTNHAKIILVGRTALTADKKKTLATLSTRRNSVEYQQIDINNLGQVKQLIASIKKKYNQLNGIIHSAGIYIDNFILKKTPAEFSKVLQPKVTGTFNLDEASRDIDLDFMVLFSSIASAIGNVGQADYAAANGFMDQFAAYRNQLVETEKRKGRTQSINWPLWQEGGMSIEQATKDMLQRTIGVKPIASTTGMLAFYSSLNLPYGQTMVLEGDVAKIRNYLFNRQDTKPKPSPIIQNEQKTIAVELKPNSLLEKTRDYLRKEFSTMLKLPIQKIDTQVGLEDYGIDSVLSIRLTEQLEKTFGPLSKTLFFEYQTIQELTAYFIEAHSDKLNALFHTTDHSQKKTTEIQAEQKPQLRNRTVSSRRFSRQNQTSATTNPINNEPIAIIGLSGRFPESKNIEEFWNNLRNGKDCIIEVPKERWDWREYYSKDRSKNGHHFSKWGGFIEGVDEFDPRFFKISPREAQTIDPQERLFLQHAWMVIEDAGYTRAGMQIPHEQDLSGQVGVYVGVMYGEYNLSGSLASIANRVSYVLNLHGPSITLDTMCSSSLTAIHLACQDLKQGRTNMAIAGGVNVSVHPNKYSMLSAGQFISGDGHCQSFGEGGDGYIPGEGVGAVMLKRLSEAQRDGNHIYGIIKGSALNHGGKTNGYSVPNPQAQTTAISRALTESNIDARYISYIEAHGTGTKLGDPIEITALNKAFAKHTPASSTRNQEQRKCLLGSAKSNIGHCESAAGIAGLAKVLLQMKHKQIVPSLHSTKLNPHIDFQNTPFVVNQTLKTWEQPEIDGQPIPRYAGISSFGAGGSNAHIIIEEYAPVAEGNSFTPFIDKAIGVMVPLSARTAEQLKQKANDLLGFIHNKQPNLVSMAYTLQVGREAMGERLGILVGSVEELAEKLKAYINGEQQIEKVYQGQVKRNADTLSMFGTEYDLKQTVEKWIDQKENTKLLDIWVKGLDLDWNKLYGQNTPQRISLPTYPFARERYWNDTADKTPQGSKTATTAVIHPLLHTNTSDLTQQSYSSIFTGKEFFLADYQANTDSKDGQKSLSASTYLEMIRVAVEKAMPTAHETSILKLHNIAWGQPAIFTGSTQINIALFPKGNNQVNYEIYSHHNSEEIVHCQGQATYTPQPKQKTLDVEQLKKQQGQRNDQILAEIKLPASLENGQSDYVLHPSLMDSAFQAASEFINRGAPSQSQLAIPYALDTLSIQAPCGKELIVSVGYSPGSKLGDTTVKLDVILSNPQGNICVQMQGLSYKQKSLDIATKTSTQTVSTAAKQTSIARQAATPQKISIPQLQPQAIEEVEIEKPSNISLDDFTIEKITPNLKGKTTVSLSNISLELSLQNRQATTPTSVSLYENGNGTYTLQIESTDNNTLTKDLIAQILQVLEMVQQMGMAKVLIIKGTEQTFLCGGRKNNNEAIAQKLFKAIATFPYPVIAAMQGNATGTGFLVGALCDFMVCGTESKYAYTDAEMELYPSAAENLFFKERLGEALATDLLYMSPLSTGEQLRTKGWDCPILPQEKVEAYVQTLASSLVEKSQEALRLLKQHLSRHLIPLANALTVEDLLTNENKHDTIEISTTSKQIRIETHKKNVLVIHICTEKKATEIKKLVVGLSPVFDQLRKGSQYKAVVLVSEYAGFLSGIAPINDVLDFQQLILDSPIPVVAALNTNAKGIAWLTSQFFDACIYNKTGHYSIGSIAGTPELAKQASMIFPHKLGSNVGKEILITGNEYTGYELSQQVGNLIHAEKAQVLETALQLAEFWAGLPIETLASWKKETASSIRKKIKGQPEWLDLKDDKEKPLYKETTPLALNTKVVTATAYPEGTLLVKMEDREAKNMFSDALVEGMNEVFDHIEKTSAYKVVVLTGYEHYFASGGTKDTLLAIQEGKTKFTDSKIYQLTKACKVPVIAAMQGHGVGAGWTLGMFADFILFSKESKYFSPYMNYGFTPGAGSTFIFPEKIGYNLAKETLLTAREYSGSELKNRGLLLPVFPRDQIVQSAMELAKQIAKHSRSSLIAFKHQWNHHLHKPLEETYAQELSMHDKTFVGQSDTIKQINENFYRGGSEPRIETDTQEKEIPAVASSNSFLPQDPDTLLAVISNIKKLLAKELLMEEDEIDENTQFIDLGLDSITGVTWVRRINEEYNTNIEATKIYNYPTIEQLGQYVRDEARKVGAFPEKPEVEASSPSSSPVQQQNAVEITAPSQSMDALPTVRASVKRLLAEELLMEEDEIDENTQFIDLGLDSITGVTWVRRINEEYKTDIEATKIYNYPTLEQLSVYVKEEAEKAGTISAQPTINAPIPTPPKTAFQSAENKLVSWRNRSTLRQLPNTNTNNPSEAVAIIGVSGQFPKAKKIDEFWQNIAQGKNCISEIPPQRWDINDFYQEGSAVLGKTNSKWLGLLDEYDQFDPLFFNISPTEAENMDPQQRLFLQESWNTIENAGYNPKKLFGSKCGVFVGVASGDYHQQSKEAQLSAQGFTGSASSILSARISYFLNLQGPCISIDTACSSSLVAIAGACDSLNSGSSDLALAGGVCVLATPAMHIMCSQTGMLSTDGKCFTFDQRANGFVPGEGVGVVMLKRLSDAEKDQDTILGVIQGWGTNQDGKTNGITAPNADSQTRLEQEVYDKYHIDPSNIQLVEAHGTGTKLGDPIEVDALKQSFKKYTTKKAYCALGSVKSNIGHSLTAAGVASFIKVLLAMKHKQLPPTINYNNLNEHISLKDSPFYVNDQLQEWSIPEAGKRQAAISAFGFSGTNAHIVLSEYVSPIEAKPAVTVITQNTKHIVPLSAKTANQLKQRAINLLNFIRKEPSTELIEMAYTLQVGRLEMGERLGIMVSSLGQLEEKLQAYINGEKNIPDVYYGEVKSNKEGLSIISQDDDMKETIIERYLSLRNLSKLLNLWVKGLDFDWHKLYGEIKPQRINLPTYPFAKERYWLEASDAGQDTNKATKLSVLHPLLHKNTSDLSQQSYSSTFSGDEFFLADHRINGHKVLPAVAYLEMIHAAIAEATKKQVQLINLELYNMVWGEPVFVEGNKEVSIAMFADDNEQINFEVYSSEAEEEIIHNQGEATLNNITAPDTLDIEDLKRQMRQEGIETANTYQAFTKMGIHYGANFHGLTAIYKGDNELLAELQLPSTVKNNQNGYYLHPVILDSAIQACIVLTMELEQPVNHPLQPIGLDKLAVVSPTTDKMYAWVQHSNATLQNEETFKFDVEICDAQGKVCIEMKGLELSVNIGTPVNYSEKTTKTESPDKAWDKMSYAYNWEEAPSSPQKPPVGHTSVLIVCNNSSHKFDSAILDYYKKNSNSETTTVRLADSTQQLSENEWTCGIQDPKGFQTCLTKTGKFDALYFLATKEQQSKAITSKELIDSQESNEIQFLRLVQTLKQNDKIGPKVDTYILTVDNHVLGSQPNNSSGAGTIGLGYSLAQGMYQFKVRNIDLSLEDLKTPKSQSDTLAAIVNEAPSNKGEAIKIHSGKRYRQTFYKLNWDTNSHISIKQNGVYLIAGGSGTVGQIFTRNFIQKYQATVVWIGRSAENSDKIQATLQPFKEFGEKLQYIQADVTNQSATQQAVRQIKEKYATINGAIFSGMVTEYEDSIDKVTEEEYRSSLGVKTIGSLNFYTALEKEPLDFICYFSSGQAYSFTGAAKCSAYASGITFTDSLVQSVQKTSKFPVGIINWGFWKKSLSKMKGVSAENLGVLEDDEGFGCFEHFVGELQQGGLQQVLCMKATPQVEPLMNCSKEQSINIKNGQAIYKALPQIRDNEIYAEPKKSSAPIQETKAESNPIENIEKHIKNVFLDSLSVVLKIPSKKIDSDTAFSDYGVDSIIGVKFIDEIKHSLNIELNNAVLFEYSSINRLSKHVLEVYQEQVEAHLNATMVSKEEPQAQPPVNKVAMPKSMALKRRPLTSRNISPSKQTSKYTEIAIVGMSGKFPKAENVNEFWENLIQGIDGVEELPEKYLDQKYFSKEKQKGKTRCKWGGILSERDCFDPLFFNLSPKEAEAMNPHQRLVMQESWKAIEDAGYNPRDLSGSSTGIFIGSEPTEYDCKSFTGYSDAIIASRLSYVLDLNGPAYVVNTGCSSSAVALHLACDSLRNKETDTAIAGGVNACMEQNLQIRLDEIEMLSPSGRCHTFDERGDGTIISEGIGILILKRLEDAIESRDQIYGVICGSGINQDGASNGITAPNGASQEQLIKNVYEKYNINPENISYIEAHGTGTKLGDPVEANALVRAFKKFTDKKGYCVVGSAKSHIGHTSSAAGVTGLIKVLLSMQHNRIPQLLNFKTMNPLVEFNDSPFFIPMQEKEWETKDNTPRMAAVNSFGHSGTNVHLVIKEYIPTERERQQHSNTKTGSDVLIPLSAKTTEQLKQLAHDLLNFIRTTEKTIQLAPMAYTLQKGREAMDVRLGFVVNSIEQLTEKLQAYINGEQKIENSYQGVVPWNKESNGSLEQELKAENIDKWEGQNNLTKLLKLWVNGLELDWNMFYGDVKHQRISLPPYPFAKERYWAENNNAVLNQTYNNKTEKVTESESIEDIINKIDEDSIETAQAVELLKNTLN